MPDTVIVFKSRATKYLVTLALLGLVAAIVGTHIWHQHQARAEEVAWVARECRTLKTMLASGMTEERIWETAPVRSGPEQHLLHATCPRTLSKLHALDERVYQADLQRQRSQRAERRAHSSRADCGRLGGWVADSEAAGDFTESEYESWLQIVSDCYAKAD